ncbi:MAG: type 1 glutamine amidotransferase [Planctomycetota bacterium]|nr:type 1 glutamine amidotransferase [Planctomycetota bacterium]
MKALIFVADGFEDMEFYYPYYRLREQGIEVDVAAPKTGRVTGKHGYTYDVMHPLEDFDSADYDLLIIPGGKAPEAMRLEGKMVDITYEMFRAGKPVGAICHGAQLLISADILQGRRATCWKGIRDDLKAAGAKYEDAEVVVDGHLVTSRCPDDLPAFCREMLRFVRVEQLVTV